LNVLLSLRKILRPYKAARSANALFAPHRFIDANCFLTKTGAIGAVLALNGLSFECSDDASLQANTARVDALMRSLSEEFPVYQYALKTCNYKIDDQPAYNHPATDYTVHGRNRFLEDRPGGLYSVDLYWVILFERQVFGRRRNFAVSNKKTLRILRDQLRRDRAALMAKAQSLCAESKDLLGLRILPKTDVFGFLRRLANLDQEVARSQSLVSDLYVDHFMCDEQIGVGKDGVTVGNNAVEVVTMRARPKTSAPHFFRDLMAVPCNFAICLEYRPVPKHDALKQVDQALDHFHSSQWMKNIWSLIQMAFSRGKQNIVPSSAAKDDLNELKRLGKELNRGDALGKLAATVVFYGPDRANLQEAVSAARKVFGQHEASVFRETYNALNAYLSIIPGNLAFSQRQLWMRRRNVSEMALVYAPPMGEKRNEFLGSEYLLVVETNDGTPYHLNLHDNDVFGVFVSGKTGAGKSVFSNTVLAHLQKLNPYTCILDIGGSYQQICSAFDGAYSRVSLGKQEFFINPFCLEPTKDNIQFLSMFVRLLLANNGYALNYEDDRNIFEAINELYAKPADDRRLGNLKIRKHLREALFNWVGQGQYGSIFDNAVDTISIAPFQVFDFQGLETYPLVVEPLFFYLFHRQRAVVYDPALRTKFKILWADEVWRFITNETCRQQFITAGKTYRKHNAGLGLVTQSAFDLKNTGLLEIISEVCPTKVLLANPNADFEAYQRIYHLNNRELENFQRLALKRQFMVKKGDEQAEVLNLNLDPVAKWLYANSPFENEKRDQYIATYGFHEGIKALAAGK
jgi:type IV secretion/conjugal transfer VirB4 family ATPase